MTRDGAGADYCIDLSLKVFYFTSLSYIYIYIYIYITSLCLYFIFLSVGVESIPPETWTFPNTPIIQTEMDYAKARAPVSCINYMRYIV